MFGRVERARRDAGLHDHHGIGQRHEDAVACEVRLVLGHLALRKWPYERASARADVLEELRVLRRRDFVASRGQDRPRGTARVQRAAMRCGIDSDRAARNHDGACEDAFRCERRGVALGFWRGRARSDDGHDGAGAEQTGDVGDGDLGHGRVELREPMGIARVARHENLRGVHIFESTPSPEGLLGICDSAY